MKQLGLSCIGGTVLFSLIIMNSDKRSYYNLSACLHMGSLILMCLLCLFGIFQVKVLGKVLDQEDSETTSAADSFLAAAFPLHYQILECNGIVCKLLGEREVNNVFRMKNDFLTLKFEELPEEILGEEAAAMIKVQDAMRERGIPFVYVAPASRVDAETDGPLGFLSGENSNDRRFLSMLKEGGVNVLDLEEELLADGLSRYDQYYSTDHHWNEEGALYCAEKLSEWLGDATGASMEPSLLNKESYSVKTIPNVMIGSYAKRTGYCFAGGREDFDVLLPAFATNYKELITGKQGSMEELFYVLEGADRISYQVTTYETVFGKDTARGYVNEEAPNDLSVLFLEDSYGYPLEPFLLTQVKALHIGSSYSPESITPELLEELHPEAVVLLKYGPFHLGHEEYFQTAF